MSTTRSGAQESGSCARKAANMNPTDTLKAVEEKMNNALLTYARRSWSDTELESCLMDELRKATIDFLELRGQLSLGCGPVFLTADLRL
jgi:hypothetical protein